MKSLLAALFLSLFALSSCAAADARIAPADAAQLVADGKAILVDVREPSEWRETGVAAPALLLAKSDFDGAQTDWKPFLEKAAASKDQTIILYCRSGNRSGKMTAALAEKGYKVVNAGGLRDWIAAGLPTRKVE